MIELEKLPDAELGARAVEWRRRALQGDLNARGVAHQLEAELRRRAGAPFPDYDTLDLRPLDLRQERRRWWWPW
ncbi:hypothetical protein ACSFBU_34295 [Variovorax sp. ZT5P30]